MLSNIVDGSLKISTGALEGVLTIFIKIKNAHIFRPSDTTARIHPTDAQALMPSSLVKKIKTLTAA